MQTFMPLKENGTPSLSNQQNFKKHHFEESSVMGKLGVTALVDYLYKQGISKRVINLDRNMAEQMNGYDAFLHLNNEQNSEARKWFESVSEIMGKDKKLEFLSTEIKTDAQNNTGNFALETFSNVPSGRRGWAYTSKSQLLLYFFINTHKLLCFNTEDLKNMTYFFDSYFSRFYLKAQRSGYIGKDELTAVDFIPYPINAKKPFSETNYGKKALAAGGIYSNINPDGTKKSARKYILVCKDEFFSRFGEKRGKIEALYNENNLFETMKLFKFSYVHALNDKQNGKDFYSRCLLVPIILLESLNATLLTQVIPSEPTLKLPYQNAKFVRGGSVCVRNRNPQTKQYETKYIKLKNSDLDNIMEGYYNNVGSKMMSDAQFVESFDYVPNSLKRKIM